MSEAERFHLEQQASFFSQATDIHGDLPSAYLYWSRHFVEPHLKELFGVSEAVGFYASCIKDHASRINSKVPLRIASIGCGEARAEIDLCKRLSAMGIYDVNFICVDIATGAIQRAQEAAQREGVAAQFSFSVMDLNEFFRGAKFDVVIAHQVLHHVVYLETLFDSIKASIGDDGIFLTVDMIGRNGHMLWPEALAIFDQFWKRLPREYKFNHGFGRYEDTFSNWDHSKEGNEGIRAQDVLSNLTKRFAFDRFFATGCLAPTLFGRQFGANFNPNKPKDREIIDTIGRIDHDLMDVGYLKPVLMYAMMSTHQIEPPRNYRLWSAEFCCRQPEDYALFNKNLNYALGVMLNFGERQSINAFLSEGWSSPEPSGVWSNDNQSSVTIPLLYPVPPVDLVLTIEGVGHVCPEKPMQTVEVTVNGGQVGHMAFKQAGCTEQFKFQLGRMAKGETEISIGFHYSDARSPVDLGISNDIRRIAFFLHSMMISTA
jgi:SAM-dependent methyltransferase